jgi:acetyl esterase/lipase
MGTSSLSQAACAMAALAGVLASTPLLRVSTITARFDAEMVRAFGGHVLTPSTAADRNMRQRPVVAADLFRGIPLGASVVTGGIPFAAPDGVPLTLTVYRPTTSGHFPTVVQIYGGAWQRGLPDDNAEFARYLAARGYVVVAIDYRHAPRWQWPAQRDDVRAALRWIRAHGAEYDADVSRLALLGRSAGAHLALMAAYDPAETAVRGVVSLYGPVDLDEGYRRPPRPNPLDVRAIDEAFLGGTPDQFPERYREASPLTYATRRLPPTLLIYGSRDHIVEARFGRMLHERLIAGGTRAALLEIPWAEHAFDAVPNGPSAQMTLYYAERFLRWALVDAHD